jgi:hypothetical protein
VCYVSQAAVETLLDPSCPLSDRSIAIFLGEIHSCCVVPGLHGAVL